MTQESDRLFDQIRTAIADVRVAGVQPVQIVLHKNDLAYIARALGVKESELTNEMILSVIG